MKEEVRIPSVGESIVEGMLMSWLKESGDRVRQDEDLYEFETEKASVVVPSPFSGILQILVREGTKVSIDQVVATIDTGVAAADEKKAVEPEVTARTAAGAGSPAGPASATTGEKAPSGTAAPLSPAVRRAVTEHGVDPSRITGSGKDGRITKGDVLEAVKKDGAAARPGASAAPAQATPEGEGSGDRSFERRPMTPIRKSIAEHLVAARREAAHLTTFNEINMERLLEIRKAHQARFEKRHGIKLGMMSFFVKASIEALKEFPALNSRIEGDDIIHYNFYDIGVAVSTERGLLVPVIRNADTLTYSEIEKKIAYLADRAKNKKILLPELQGGTFSITNGGIFGSLMSTPIPNHPQPAILGMHAIKDRPVAEAGAVVIRPMMYAALTYDHRLIDGRDAVSFLVRIKEYVEDPEEMLLES